MKKLTLSQIFDRAEKVNYGFVKDYIENKNLEGKSYLGNGVENVRKIPLKISLHHSFCNPKEVIDEIEEKMKNKTVTGYYQNGNYICDVVISDYKVNVKQMIGDSIIYAEVDVTLLESVDMPEISTFSEQKFQTFSFSDNSLINFIANATAIALRDPLEMALQQVIINGLSEGEEQVFDTIKSEVVSSIMQQGLFYADEIIDAKIEELEKSNSLSAVGLELIKDSLHTIPKVITLTAERQPEEVVETIVAESNSKDWIIPCNGKITSPFGWRIDPITKNKTWHNGWDIKADIGTVFVAIADGKISFAGKSDPTGYAHYIVIDHGKINGKFVTSEYGHISKHYYPAGTEVKKGQPIGETGNEGKSTKPHLHLTIRESKSKKRGIGVNPSLYIKR